MQTHSFTCFCFWQLFAQYELWTSYSYPQSESAIHDPKFERRKNIVLMGDSLGDLHMAEGIPNPNVILKIGFLNKNNEKDLAKYKVGWVLHEDLVFCTSVVDPEWFFSDPATYPTFQLVSDPDPVSDPT